MNAPRPRTTLNIIFEDLTSFQNQCVSNVDTYVTGRQDIANLKKNPLNLPVRFFTDLNERIEQASEMSPGGEIEQDFPKQSSFACATTHHLFWIN